MPRPDRPDHEHFDESDFDEADFADADFADTDFDREIALIRSVATEPVELVDAPAGLWDRIAAEAGVEPDAAPDAGLASSDDATATDPGGVAPVVDLAARRRRWATVLISAAAAIAVIAGVGVFAATRPDPSPTELAAAELLPFEGAQVGDAAGQVELIDDGEQLSLRVDMRDLPAPAPGTFYELWLIDPNTGEPVSIATMKDGSSDVATEIAIPSGTDPARYDVVDVSVQEEDAGPEHSGNSVLRGTLSA